MPYLVGMDEAGYGPNLGPLVVSATAWHVPDDPAQVDLYERLGTIVRSQADHEVSPLVIADSKVLFKPGGGLSPLERSLFAAFAQVGPLPTDWNQLWLHLDADRDDERNQIPWYVGYQSKIPVHFERHELPELAARFNEALAASKVRLLAIRSQAVFPRQFNRLIEQFGSKGEALTTVTLRLLSDIMSSFADEPVFVICDKHGGRNRYGTFLQEEFSDRWVEVLDEGRAASIYRWGSAETRVEIRFCRGGESFLPAALASMASKYLRELCMRAFNEYWCRQIPGLRKTAGYPVDALRFRSDIAACQRQLGIDDMVLWRNR